MRCTWMFERDAKVFASELSNLGKTVIKKGCEGYYIVVTWHHNGITGDLTYREVEQLEGDY